MLELVRVAVIVLDIAYSSHPLSHQKQIKDMFKASGSLSLSLSDGPVFLIP